MKSVNNTIEWVDIHDDALMISLGIHPKNATPRDPSVWTKTAKERKELKKLRLRHKHDHMFGGTSESAAIPVYDKLIVYMKNGKTLSIKCGQSDIKTIINHHVDEKGNNLVIKYYWNGRTYLPDTLPFWYW